VELSTESSDNILLVSPDLKLLDEPELEMVECPAEAMSAYVAFDTDEEEEAPPMKRALYSKETPAASPPAG
jgi:hypothetical protein